MAKRDDDVQQVDEDVEIYPAAEDMQDTAKALLDAADDPEHDVRTVSGGFVVSKALAGKAGVTPAGSGDEEHAEPRKPAPRKAPAKSTAKTPAAAVERGATPGGGDAAK